MRRARLERLARLMEQFDTEAARGAVESGFPLAVYMLDACREIDNLRAIVVRDSDLLAQLTNELMRARERIAELSRTRIADVSSLRPIHLVDVGEEIEYLVDCRCEDMTHRGLRR